MVCRHLRDYYPISNVRAGDSLLLQPQGLTLDRAGHLYVGDSGNNLSSSSRDEHTGRRRPSGILGDSGAAGALFKPPYGHAARLSLGAAAFPFCGGEHRRGNTRLRECHYNMRLRLGVWV